MKVIRAISIAAAAILLLVSGASGALAKEGKVGKEGKQAGNGREPKALFSSDAVVQISIAAPFGPLVQPGADPEKSVAGTLTVKGAAPEQHAITLAPRGVKRRDKQVCQFPPFWVSFAEKPAKSSLFQGQKRLKLVTHCRSVASFQQYVALEYAAYRIYALITPESFHARPVMIDYLNEKGQPLTTRLGFFIEDADAMAKRNGLHEINAPNRVPSAQLVPRDAVRYALFQMMIGNLDWAMNQGAAGQACCHNSKLIGAKDATSDLVPVPYDFDSAGLVSTPYAAPPAGIPVSSVRVRRYRGYCRHNAEVPAQLQSLAPHRADIVAVLRSVPQLTDRARGEAIDYIEDFFQQIATQPDFAAKIVKICV